MLRLLEGENFVELQSRTPVGLRMVLGALSLVPLLAPYELIVRPDWRDYGNPAFIFAALIAAGAIALSAILMLAALAGLNSRMRFDAAQRLFVFSRGAPVIPWRSVRYPLGEVRQVLVEKHEWSDGPPSYSLVARTADGKALKSGASQSAKEVECFRARVSELLERRGTVANARSAAPPEEP